VLTNFAWTSWLCVVQAAKCIFGARNTAKSLSAGRIDLHGLHVVEAEECLRSLVPDLWTQISSPISIVTGSG
jgi:hypothetical protein